MQIKYGKDHKHLADGSYPLYGSGGIMRYVEKPLYDDESILIPRKGTLSNLFYLDQPFWSVDTMFYSKINKDLVLPKYLFYTLKTCDLASLNVGSAVPSLTTEVLNDILVTIPDLYTQTTIAEILSSLDDKIELNNKINQELETLAQTLFKHWFIDFEFPNENGEPYKSSGGEMVDSELGVIPNGWSISTIEDITEVVTKGTTPTTIGGKFTESGINFIKVESLTEQGGFIDETTNQLLKRSIINEGDVLFSIAGTIGRVAVVTKDILPANTNQAIAIIRPSKVDSIFLKLLMQSALIQNDTKSNVVQAVQANLSLGVIKATKFIKPSSDLLAVFESFSKEVFEYVNKLTEENQELSRLRDTLLPNLISGELEVSQAQTIT
jgi:type I restriction enzyme S subunit